MLTFLLLEKRFPRRKEKGVALHQDHRVELQKEEERADLDLHRLVICDHQRRGRPHLILLLEVNLPQYKRISHRAIPICAQANAQWGKNAAIGTRRNVNSSAHPRGVRTARVHSYTLAQQRHRSEQPNPLPKLEAKSLWGTWKNGSKPVFFLRCAMMSKLLTAAPTSTILPGATLWLQYHHL